jgi:hypothetical protein
MQFRSIFFAVLASSLTLSIAAPIASSDRSSLAVRVIFHDWLPSSLTAWISSGVRLGICYGFLQGLGLAAG